MTYNDYTELPYWSCGAKEYVHLATLEPIKNDDKQVLSLNHSAGSAHYATFPEFRNADWDLSQTEYFELQVKPQEGLNLSGINPTLYLWNRDGSCIRIRPAEGCPVIKNDMPGKWQTIKIPIKEAAGWDYVYFMSPSIEHIDYFEIHFEGVGLPEGAAHHVLIDGVTFGPTPLPYTPPNVEAGNLDVLIIERNPKYERYDMTDGVPPVGWPEGVPFQACKNIAAKHQPDEGETVTFTAYVQNKGKSPLGGKFVWTMDGKEVAKGELPVLKPKDKVSFEWQWAWDPADHDLSFKVIPDGEDYCDLNNKLTIRTNALMYKFMIERGALSWMETKRNMYGTLSCEDWIQGQLRYMNRLFEMSSYDFAPDGITQRVMAGKFEYVEDGEMVALGEGPFRVGETDITVDGGRGLTAFDNPWGRGSGGIYEYLNHIGGPDDAWLHELAHQIGVIDDYQIIMPAENNKVNGVGFTFASKGIMGGGFIHPHPSLQRLYGPWSRSNVQGLNATKGKRRGYFGEYLFQVPDNCTLQITDESGKPITDAEVKVYQTQDRVIERTPVHEGVADANGLVPLKNRKVAASFTTETGITLHDNPFGEIHVVGFNGLFLVIVHKNGKELYGFTTIMDFNTAYAAGQAENAEIPVTVKEKGDETIYLAH